MYIDRVRETSTSTGTGAFILDGAANNRLSFSEYGNESFDYCIEDAANNQFEVGKGTYAGGVLTRVSVYRSTNNNTKVDFEAGTKAVFSTIAANNLLGKDQVNVVDKTPVSLVVTLSEAATFTLPFTTPFVELTITDLVDFAAVSDVPDLGYGADVSLTVIESGANADTSWNGTVFVAAGAEFPVLLGVDGARHEWHFKLQADGKVVVSALYDVRGA